MGFAVVVLRGHYGAEFSEKQRITRGYMVGMVAVVAMEKLKNPMSSEMLLLRNQ